MRRALRYVAIWCGATVVAVSVSWFGVRGVLRSEFVDDVDVQPFAARTAAADAAPPELRSPTPTGRRTTAPAPRTTAPAPKAATPAPEATTPAPRRTTRKPVPPTSTVSPTGTPTPGDGSLKVMTVKGGEVVFRMTPGECRLVSATPAGGYTARVSRADNWIRVDLVKGEHGTGVFCIGHEQRTDTWEY